MAYRESSTSAIPAGPSNAPAPFLLHTVNCNALAQAIANGEVVIYEADVLTDILSRHNTEDAKSVFIGLRSRSVYDAPLGPAIAEGLARRYGLSTDTEHKVAIALSEALSNSLIHGNLEIQGNDDHMDSSIWSQVAERIDNPRFATRPIWLSAGLDNGILTIVLENEGPGHDGNPLNKERPAYRGLNLMQAATLDMTYTDGMRCLTMTFSL